MKKQLLFNTFITALLLAGPWPCITSALAESDWSIEFFDGLGGDTNRDGTVDIWDLLQIAEHWLSDCGQP